jgi:hypothetical protein
MTEALMMTWIEHCLAPYVSTAPEGIIPVLFLDSYGVHKMGSVNRTINDLGIEVIILPPGCTGITQPVNIGYNKPLKNLICVRYEEWMVTNSEDLSKPPRRIDIARWIVDAKHNMKRSTMVNAWMRHDFEYFPHASCVVDVPEVVHAVTAKDVTVISDMDDDGSGGDDGGDNDSGSGGGNDVVTVS